MILSCPSCNTRYNLEATALKGGRAVRCTKCGDTWHPDPPDDLPMVVDVEVEADVGAGAEDAPDAPEAPPPETVEVPNVVRRRPAPKQKSSAGSVGWIALAAVLAVSMSLLFFFRGGIVAAWPPSARLYQALWLTVDPPSYGLELRNLTSSQAFDGDVPMLSVTGQVVNVSDQDRIVPRVRIGLTNEAGREIYHWTFIVPDRELGPGKATGFSTTLASPPEAAKHLAVTFLQE